MSKFDAVEHFPKLASIASRFSLCLAVLSALATVLLVVLVILDVAGRTAVRSGIPGTLEIVTFALMPLSVFSAYAYAERKGEHIIVTLLTDQMRGRFRALNQTGVSLLNVLGVAILAYYGFQSALQSISILQTDIGAVTVPVWPIKIFMVIGLLSFLLQSVVSLLQNWSSISESTVSREGRAIS